jgi:hypothetical protein
MAHARVESQRVRRLALSKLDDGRPSEHPGKWLIGVGALFLMGCGIISGSPVATSIGATMAGLLLVWRLVIDWRSGVTSSNWGTWRRDLNPLGFRCNVGFWAAVAMLWFVLALVILLELIRLPTA